MPSNAVHNLIIFYRKYICIANAKYITKDICLNKHKGIQLFSLYKICDKLDNIK